MKHIIHRVKSWIRQGKAPASASTLVYVMVTPKPLPASDILTSDPGAVLRRLISFSSRENLPLAVILPGKPNRRYPDGSRQNGVLVRYATNEQALHVTEATMTEVGAGHSVVVITDIPAIEKFAASRHCRTLRIETFEKAVESVAGPLRREVRPQREPSAQRQAGTTAPEQRQAPQQPPPKPATDSEAGQKPPHQEAPEQSAPKPARKEKDQAILDLIDPL